MPPIQKTTSTPFHVVIIDMSQEPAKPKTWFERAKSYVLLHPGRVLIGTALLAVLSYMAPRIISQVGSLFGSAPPTPPISPAPPAPVPPSSALNPGEIKVFTSYTTDNPDRLTMSRKVSQDQQNYCKEKGYQYNVYEVNIAKDSLPYWSKIAGMTHLLNSPAHMSTKWFVWIDDDAIFTNKKIRIEDFIQGHGGSNPQTHVIISEDVPHATTKLNTGVIFVRNSDFSRKFFQELWNKRHQTVPRLGSAFITYSKCANQLCLHEQEAMHNLLKDNPSYLDQVKIIPQRDDKGIGMNVFRRENHIDENRNRMFLDYDYDPWQSKYAKGDFITQCTGLSTNGRREPWTDPTNLRLECIDFLIQDSIKA